MTPYIGVLGYLVCECSLVSVIGGESVCLFIKEYLDILFASVGQCQLLEELLFHFLYWSTKIAFFVNLAYVSYRKRFCLSPFNGVLGYPFCECSSVLVIGMASV